MMTTTKIIRLGKDQVGMMNPPTEGTIIDKHGSVWIIGSAGDGARVLRNVNKEVHPEFVNGLYIAEFCQWINSQMD